MQPPDPASDTSTGSATDTATWLTVDQAATAYGVHVRTIWRRLERPNHGGMVARRVQTPAGEEWRIQPPAGAALPPEGQASPVPGQALIPLAAVDRLLGPYVAERDALKAEIAALQAARLEDAREIGRLEERVAALTIASAAASDTASDTASAGASDTPPRPRRRRWFWQRAPR